MGVEPDRKEGAGQRHIKKRTLHISKYDNPEWMASLRKRGHNRNTTIASGVCVFSQAKTVRLFDISNVNPAPSLSYALVAGKLI